MTRTRASRVDLTSQAEELRLLRGKRTLKVWCLLLGVPQRTYIRYEQGQRLADKFFMTVARQKGTKRRRLPQVEK